MADPRFVRAVSYSEPLKNKTIERCYWHGDPDKDYCCLAICFTDDTMVSFSFDRFVNEEAELADILDNKQALEPIPLRVASRVRLRQPS